MVETERLICSSTLLEERGTGLRFALPELGERMTGFVVRYNGRPYSYINHKVRMCRLNSTGKKVISSI